MRAVAIEEFGGEDKVAEAHWQVRSEHTREPDRNLDLELAVREIDSNNQLRALLICRLRERQS